MKKAIYTIPLTDAFKANDECPLCHIERQLEQEAITFILGPSYMEADIHDELDTLGCCRHHYKMMYDYGNQLGIAIILQTWYHKMNQQLQTEISQFSPKKASILHKFKSVPDDIGTRPPETSIGRWIYEKEETCYVCRHFQSKYPRYLDTLLKLVTTDADFNALFKNSKGFCLHHFKDIMEAAESTLSDKARQAFYPQLFELMTINMHRLEEDINWFVDKYDYRNKDADWKTSKDANPRGIQKICGGYPADPPFRKHL